MAKVQINPESGNLDLVGTSGGGGGGGTVTSVAGGTGITNVPEPIVGAGTVNLDIESLVTEVAISALDLIPFVDVSVAGPITNQRKITFTDLATAVDASIGPYQPLDADLTAYAALATTGIVVRTGAGTVTTRSIAVTDTGTIDLTITNADGVAGNPTLQADMLGGPFQPLDAGLTALSSLGAGIAVSDGADGWTPRSIAVIDTATVNLTITNADGVAGNPTLQADVLAGTVAPAAHNFLDSTVHNNTLTGLPVRGDLIVGNATPAWARFGIGAANTCLRSDGTDPAWSTGILDNNARVMVRISSGADVGPRRRLNFNFSDGIIGAALDDAGSEEVDLFFLPSNDLGVIEALVGTGYLRRTGVETWVLDASAAGSIIIEEDNVAVAGSPATTLDFAEPDEANWITIAGGEAEFNMGRYARLLGRTGGQTFNGGLATETTANLTLKAHNDSFVAANTGRIIAEERIQILPLSATLGANAVNLIESPSGSVYTHDNASSIVRGYDMRAEVKYTTSPALGFPGAFFNFSGTVRAATNPISMSNYPSFRNEVFYIADGVLFTLADGFGGMMDTPSFTVASAGTYSGTYNSFYSNMTINAGAAITNRRGINIVDALGSGTLTTQVGVRIADLVKGTTNISLLSVGTAVQMRHAGPAALGINAAPNTTADVNGDFATRAANLALANGNNDNIAIGARSFIRITGPTAAFTIRGIASGFDGKHLVLYNTTTQNMTINNEDAGSTAANRIRTMTGAAVATVGEGTATLVYDATLSRWLLISMTV